MARKKVKLAYISNQRARQATYKKRKGGFIKKLSELSVLCGIEACAVIFSPFNSNPDVWPSNSGVEDALNKLEMLTEMEQEKRTVNHEGFLQKSISKTMESNNKKIKDNSEKTMKEVMFHLLRGEGDKLELNDGNREDLCKYIDEYLKQLYYHRNVILNHQSNLEYGESSSAAAAGATVIPPTTIVEEGFSSIPNNEVRPIISLNHRPQQVSPTIARDDGLQRDVEQQGNYPMMNPNGVNDQHLNINTNHNEDQQQMMNNSIDNSDSNENENQGWLIDQMMNNSKQMSCLSLDDNNSYHQQQP